MAIYKTKWFDKWASKNGLSDTELRVAVEELENDLFDANLGGDVYKKRVGIHNQGKRGGARTLIAFKKDGHVFFMFGFAKNKQANIKTKELKALKLLAKQFLDFSERNLVTAIDAGELVKVSNDG